MDNAQEDLTEPLKALEPMNDHPMALAHVIAGVALTMAMKFHDINTIKEGALYQQYKLEGKNIQPLHLDMVFETAIKIERHLLASSDRIAAIIVDALEVRVEDEPETAVETHPEIQPEARKE